MNFLLMTIVSSNKQNFCFTFSKANKSKRSEQLMIKDMMCVCVCILPIQDNNFTYKT